MIRAVNLFNEYINQNSFHPNDEANRGFIVLIRLVQKCSCSHLVDDFAVLKFLKAFKRAEALNSEENLKTKRLKDLDLIDHSLREILRKAKGKTEKVDPKEAKAFLEALDYITHSKSSVGLNAIDYYLKQTSLVTYIGPANYCILKEGRENISLTCFQTLICTVGEHVANSSRPMVYAEEREERIKSYNFGKRVKLLASERQILTYFKRIHTFEIISCIMAISAIAYIIFKCFEGTSDRTCQAPPLLPPQQPFMTYVPFVSDGHLPYWASIINDETGECVQNCYS